MLKKEAPPIYTTAAMHDYETAVANEARHLYIVAGLLDDAAHGCNSFADRPFNISAVRKHAAWLHRVVVEFQEMFGHMPDPLFGGELLEVFNTVKDSPSLTSDHLLALASAIANEQRRRAAVKNGKV